MPSCSNTIASAAGVDGDAAADGRIREQRRCRDSCHAARMPAISVTSPSTASVSAVRSNAMRAAVASSSRAGAPPPASTVTVVSTSVAVTEPFGSTATTALAAEAAVSPRRSSAKLQRRVELDGLAAADAARRQRQAGHAVAQLGRVLAPVDVAVDGCARPRSRSRRRLRRRARAGAAGAGALAASSEVLPVAAQLRVAGEVQRQAFELDGADLDAARQERQELDARRDAARRRERLRAPPNVGCAADRDAAGLDGEPREVGEPEVLVDRERAAGARRERVGRDAFVIVGIERRREDRRPRRRAARPDRRDGGRAESSRCAWLLLQAGRRAKPRCRETT